jgi:proteic killer suppression protein
VVITLAAEKSLERLPTYISVKLNSWVELVTVSGLNYARTIPGFHDEPLHGKRKGQRSIRLSKSYRAIYVICEDTNIEFVEIRDVNKHDY